MPLSTAGDFAVSREDRGASGFRSERLEGNGMKPEKGMERDERNADLEQEIEDD